MRLIEAPKLMREDTTYPQQTKQAFFWQDNSAEWRFSFPSKGYAYAGFRFLYPYNLSEGIDSYEIRFTLSPASKARLLWIALVDGDDQPPNVLVELPVREYAGTTSGNGHTEVRIPIREFPRLGAPVLREKAVESHQDQAFDWKDVRELRMVNSSGRFPDGDVAITNLRIER